MSVTDDWVKHVEIFDEYEGSITGDADSCRLTIFRIRSLAEMRRIKKAVGRMVQVSPSVIVFQADANGFLAVKKLKNLIGDFRYDLINQEYIDLRKFGK